MKFSFEAACLSHRGNRRRNNEDNFFFHGICMKLQHANTHDPLLWEDSLNQDVCFAVFDGMGGENDGELASFTAAQEMRSRLRQPQDFYMSTGSYLADLTQKLNTAVWDKAQELKSGSMGTTLAALYLTPRFAYACNVGNSRVYRLRGQVFSQMSVDHTSSHPAPEGRKAPLIQYLGMNPREVRLEPRIVKDQLAPGDIYLICSNGLTDMVSNLEISGILSETEDIADTADRLLRAALRNDGLDNITLIVCRITA